MSLKKSKFLTYLLLCMFIFNIPLFAQPSACGEMIAINYELNYPIIKKTPGIVKTFFANLRPFSPHSSYSRLEKNDIVKGVVYTDPVTNMDTQLLFSDNFDLSTLNSWLSKDSTLTVIIERNGTTKSVACCISELNDITVDYSYTTEQVPILSYDSNNLEFNFINPFKISSDSIKSSEVLLLDNSASPNIAIGKIQDASSSYCTTQLISSSASNQLLKDYSHLDSNKVYLALKDSKSANVNYFEVQLCEDIWGTEIKINDKYPNKLISKLGYDSIVGAPVLKGSNLIGFVKVHDMLISAPRLYLSLLANQFE